MGEMEKKVEKINDAKKFLDICANVANQAEILMNNSKDEAIRLEDKGLGALMVTVETIKLVEDLKRNVGELQLHLHQDRVLNVTKVVSLIERLMDTTEKTDLLSFNGKIEAVRLGDCGKGFQVVFEELNKLADALHRALQEIESVLGIREEKSHMETLLRLLEKVGKRASLLALNNSIEAARAGENGRGVALISEEIKNVSNSIQQIVWELDSVVNK